ncbi:MAG: DNA-protecting protein DprA [Chlorobiaceae bacterium]|nr:DNA-protecting protein DprA [Chlorobiaceae bacterium]NTV61249.1 DNA-protecting protein DprA [Chlorobiaceae bacterium]
MEKKLPLLLLSLIPGIGPARIKAVVSRYPDLRELGRAGIVDFMAIPGIGEPLAKLIHGFLRNVSKRSEAEKSAEAQLEKLLRCNGSLVTLLDEEYPRLLREIDDPPPYLFVRGTLPSSPYFSIVGTRKASPYGKQCTAMFSRELVSCGFTISSGMAYGIDMAAHHAALENGGTTVAVLAGGIDNIYTDPKGRLWPRIVENGALISEEWIGSALSPAKFPKRNRIISGLSAGTLVVESDLNGGSLITASIALEQNREVFAVPGSIFSPQSKGTNRLVQQSQAKAVMGIGDILDELGIFCDASSQNNSSGENELPYIRLDEQEQSIIGKIGKDPLHIDLLAARTGIGIETLLVLLFELEMKNAVQQLPGQLFRKRCR